MHQPVDRARESESARATYQETPGFGALLRGYRLAAGLTQGALAEKAMLSLRGIADLERGARRFPYADTVERLAESLRLTGAERANFQVAGRRTRAAPVPLAVHAVDSPDVDFAPVPGYGYLPLQLTSMVGREQELAEVQQLLGRTRLLTLVGVGGIGKTRLAFAAVDGVIRAHPDRVACIELASLADAALVPATVAAKLGVREQSGRSMRATLIDALRPRTLLLLLDNCEHIVEACAALVNDLLRACAGVVILATSREPLHTPGELTWRVPPLSAPDMGQPSGPAELTEYPAVRLFIERAQAVQPSFALTPDNCTAVAGICARLDGLPLAIELAAARTRVLTPGQIVERLDSALRLLVGGSRTAPTRQQTLRATLDWSFLLLEPAERRLLKDVAVFAGGFDLDAAEAVCGVEGAPQSDVLDALTGLVDRSLVEAFQLNRAMRYRLLEPVRQWANEREVTTTDRRQDDLRRHAGFFCRLAEQAAEELNGPNQEAWYVRLEQEHDNLRQALGWWHTAALTEASGPELRAEALVHGLRMATALWSFWWVRGYASEGQTFFSALLALEGSPTPSAEGAKARVAAGWMEMVGGCYEPANALLDEGLAIARQIGDERTVSKALSGLGNLARYRGDYALARKRHVTSLEIRRRLGYPHDIAQALSDLGVVAYLEADYDVAYVAHEESLGLSRALGDRRGTGRCLGNMSSVVFAQGDLARALALSKEALVIWRELGDRWAFASSLERFAGLAAAAGRPAEALRLAGAAASIRETCATPLAPAGKIELERWLEPARRTLDHSAATSAYLEGQRLEVRDALARALTV